MKKILITGVSRGLGKVLTEYLTSRNIFVYGTVRDSSDYKNSKNVMYLQLDLCDKLSIELAVKKIFENTDKLDAVIHNAGIAYLNPSDEMTDLERRHTFDVNFFGPIFLTEQILPYFRKANDGKIISLSSIASVDPWPGLGVYSASKAALERVSFEWAVLLRRWSIDVSIIRANPLPTDMQILKSINTLSSEYGSVFCNELKWEKIDDVCRLILSILESDSPEFEYETGQFSKKTVDSILGKNAYKNLIQEYRKRLNL